MVPSQMLQSAFLLSDLAFTGTKCKTFGSSAAQGLLWRSRFATPPSQVALKDQLAHPWLPSHPQNLRNKASTCLGDRLRSIVDFEQLYVGTKALGLS